MRISLLQELTLERQTSHPLGSFQAKRRRTPGQSVTSLDRAMLRSYPASPSIRCLMFDDENENAWSKPSAKWSGKRQRAE